MLKLAVRIQQNKKMRIALVLCAGAVCAVGAFYLYHHNPHSYPLPCIFYMMTGLYCPGCGGTRAVRLLLTGHIWKSFLHHPGVLFAAALYLWFMVSQTIERLSKGKLEVGLPYSDRFLYWEIVVILIQCLIKNLVKIFWGIGIL